MKISINKLVLMGSVLVLSGCSLTPKSCYKTVALTRLTLSEVAKSVNVSAKGDIVSLGDNERAATIVKTARTLTSKALPLCAIDKEKAFNVLAEVNTMIIGIEKNER